MADTSDVENELATLVGSAVYPNGTLAPSIAATQVTLTAATVVGATSASVASANGLSAGMQVAFYGGTAELATVAPGYEAGSLTVPLAAPLGAESWTGLVNAHANGSIVTWNDAVEIFRGWPVSAELDAQLGAGNAQVSIFPPEGMERNTTRYPRDDQVVTQPVHTLTATVNGNTITIGGAVAVPQNVIALCGSKFAFPYPVQANDTPGSIATNLAALIAAQFPGTAASGEVITVAGKPGILQARIAGAGTTWTELARQEKTYWITCWCPTPAMRDVLAAAIDVALKQLDFITLADQSAGRLRYSMSRVSDQGQKVQIYRRDLVYTVEYPTSLTSNAYETGAFQATESNQNNQSVTSYV